MRSLAVVLFVVGCGSPPAKPPVTPTEPVATDDGAQPAEPPAADLTAAIEWNEIRSWDGLFVIGVPKSADVDEFLMALVPIRGTADTIDFMVRIEKLPLTTKKLVDYQPYLDDGATTKVGIDTAAHVQFDEKLGDQTARHDVKIQRGDTLAIVWESVYRHAKADPKELAIQTEMANRFRVEKNPP